MLYASTEGETVHGAAPDMFSPLLDTAQACSLPTSCTGVIQAILLAKTLIGQFLSSFLTFPVILGAPHRSLYIEVCAKTVPRPAGTQRTWQLTTPCFHQSDNPTPSLVVDIFEPSKNEQEIHSL